MYRRSEKNVKQQYLLHMSSQYGEPWPTSGRDRFGCLGHTSKFQRVSRLGSVTAAMSLNGGQPKFARCLAVSWAGTVYIFGGSCPLTEFCPVHRTPPIFGWAAITLGIHILVHIHIPSHVRQFRYNIRHLTFDIQKIHSNRRETQILQNN